jgi:hypothetical protein
MSAYRVKPDPFWKSVRPVVPKDVIYGTFVTSKTYTTCFTGVVVPYVCTSGSKVCGNWLFQLRNCDPTIAVVIGGAETLRAANHVHAPHACHNKG